MANASVRRRFGVAALAGALLLAAGGLFAGPAAAQTARQVFKIWKETGDADG